MILTKVVGIRGSPRENGNTDILLNALFKGAADNGADIESIPLRKLEIFHCQGCNRCFQDGECIIEDDMQDVYKALESADVIVLATPVYFSGMSSLMKQMVDRCQCLWARSGVLKRGIGPPGRRGVLISVGGQSEPVFRNIISVVRSFFNSVDVSYVDGIFVPNTDGLGEIEKDPKRLSEAYEMGIKLTDIES